MTHAGPSSRHRPALWLLLLLGALAFTGCRKEPTAADSSSPDAPAAVAAPPAVELLFTYGSEKENWIKNVTSAFNDGKSKTADGKIVHVTEKAMGSGESIDALIDGRIKADLTSPASMAFVELGNARSRAQTGQDLIGPTDNLVLSPVVIAMWKPMAEALGWGTKPVGWSDILALAKNPAGWGAYGHPEWGAFKFGHTHPEHSNSGLISVLAEVYAATGKTRGLTADDLDKPEIGQYVEHLESAVVHYGSSTGFFGRRMFAGGQTYLSAAVLYESMVIESAGQPNLATPLVAIYPKEGTFWSDHPVGIVQREWVTPEKQAAAKLFIDYLLAAPQQQKAITFGFRPGDPKISLQSPFDPAHGVDPKQPQTVLEVPSADRMNRIIQLWHQHKKRADIVLVFDCSGSMSEQSKMPSAKNGALQLINLLDDQDQLSLLPFSSAMEWKGRNLPMGTQRAQAVKIVGAFEPSGQTRLYDAVDAACKFMQERPDPTRIAAVVVLTDGEDSGNGLTLDQLIQRLHDRIGPAGMRVFTIGYGADAKSSVLKRISDETSGKYYDGTPQNIKEVFEDIATFF